jgi:hypothetical protein
MTTSTIFDDLSNRKHLSQVLAIADEGEISLERLRELAYGTASARDVVVHGEHWLRTLVDLLQRGGIGQLERRADGRIVFVFTGAVPTAEEAWTRCESSSRA